MNSIEFDDIRSGELAGEVTFIFTTRKCHCLLLALLALSACCISSTLLCTHTGAATLIDSRERVMLALKFEKSIVNRSLMNLDAAGAMIVKNAKQEDNGGCPTNSFMSYKSIATLLNTPNRRRWILIGSFAPGGSSFHGIIHFMMRAHPILLG